MKLRNLLIKVKNKFAEIKAKPKDNWDRQQNILAMLFTLIFERLAFGRRSIKKSLLGKRLSI